MTVVKHAKCRVWTKASDTSSMLLTIALYCSAITVKITATVYGAPAMIARHCVKYLAYFKPLNLHIKCMKTVLLVPLCLMKKLKVRPRTSFV